MKISFLALAVFLALLVGVGLMIYFTKSDND